MSLIVKRLCFNCSNHIQFKSIALDLNDENLLNIYSQCEMCKNKIKLSKYVNHKYVGFEIDNKFQMFEFKQLENFYFPCFDCDLIVVCKHCVIRPE